MYEDWANERITEYNFNMMSQKFQTEQQELDERIEKIVVHEATKNDMCFNQRKIDIYFRYAGKID